MRCATVNSLRLGVQTVSPTHWTQQQRAAGFSLFAHQFGDQIDVVRWQYTCTQLYFAVSAFSYPPLWDAPRAKGR